MQFELSRFSGIYTKTEYVVWIYIILRLYLCYSTVKEGGGGINSLNLLVIYLRFIKMIFSTTLRYE